jgi:hypothetical protein
MLDADKSLESRWESVQGKLKNYPYAFPSRPNTYGTVVEEISDKPKLGFWFMPNNQNPGMLEDFCAELAEPAALAFARECVGQASEREVATFKEVHRSKAVIHTYLAWQDEPGCPLGTAIASQALSPGSDIAVSFTQWLTTLFT